MPAQVLDVSGALAHARTQHGETLAAMSHASPLIVVFLHRFQCNSCRQTVIDLVRLRPRLEQEGARVVLAHLGPDAEARTFLDGLGQDVVHVSDRGRWLHRAFRFRPGGPLEWMAHRMWLHDLGVVCGKREADGGIGGSSRGPGIFLVYREAIVHEYRQKPSDERPEDAWLGSRLDLPLF